VTAAGKKRHRCAVYTRKSTEAGLEQDFNSLRAGTHPASLTIETLTRAYDLPVSWPDQENLVAALT